MKDSKREFIGPLEPRTAAVISKLKTGGEDKPLTFQEWCAHNGYAWDSLGKTFKHRAEQYEKYLFGNEVKHG